MRNRIRTLRNMREMSASDLAIAIGVKTSTVYSIESGRITPPQHRLEKIAQVFSCSVSDLMVEDQVNPSVGSELKSLREKQGLSRSEVAAAIGVQTGTVAAIESGKIKVVPEHRLSAYAKVLKLSLKSLAVKFSAIAFLVASIAQPSLAHHEGVGAGKRNMAKSIVDDEEYQFRIEQNLDTKIKMTAERIHEWVKKCERDYGGAYVSYSGGKDSTVLLHIIRSLGYDHERVPAVFCDTGLEFPELRRHVLDSSEPVIVLKPVKKFNKIIEEDGFPVIGKNQAKIISEFQRGVAGMYNPDRKTELLTHERKGMDKKLRVGVLPKKYHFALEADAPKISKKCCDYMKIEPMNRYSAETGRFPMTATMASEGQQRKNSYKASGCNSFGAHYCKKCNSENLSELGRKDCRVVWECADCGNKQNGSPRSTKRSKKQLTQWGSPSKKCSSISLSLIKLLVSKRTSEEVRH